MKFAKFMASPLGRGIRIVAGLALIAWGISQGTTLGTVVGVLGFLPLIAGLFNLCFLAALIGGPFKGSDALKS
jgi:hypothetical protein